MADGRNLKLTKNKNGFWVAQFNKFIYGKVYHVERVITDRELKIAKKVLRNNDVYEIESFCYSLA